MKDTLPTRIRFGSFELDLKSGELREGDHRTPLQVQPFKVLLILLEHNGEIVTREEIKKQLWPNDTIVEFDHSINVAVGTLRRALGDSAEEPKYIETLARRGYRLMVPVEWPEAAGDNLPEMPTSLRPESWIGRKVSHYRVLEIIGGGGMGLVYKAEDLKLGRRVALKFLPEELAGDPVALQRFEREAQTASSLNHPNICTIHEVEEQEGQPFIVMELLEGETLRDRLATAASGTRTVSLDELLQIAIQVCDGLEAAHQKSIIHRDIKPANIFLTISGQVKILDFGLAKLVVGAPGDRQLGPATGDGVEAPDFSPANTDENERGLQPRPELKPVAEEEPGRRAEARRFYQPAADSHLTRTGAAMGTAGYMSPEQVRGEKLDARTDLFSFGLVLYEMATGQRAFAGETAAIVHDAIQNKAPVPVRELNSSLPAKLVTTIDRALEKKRETRYQNAAEMGRDLRGLQQRSSTRVRSARFILTGLAASILSGIGFLLFRTESQKRKPAGQSVVRQLTPTSVESPLLGALALSPNGKQLMYLDRKKGLCLLQVDSGENRSFANTTTFAPINWLPDGEHILVSKATDSGIWNMSVLDGTTRKFRDDGLLPYPSPDGHHIAFLSSGGENAEIWLMEATEVTPHKIASIETPWYLGDLTWSPTGQQIAYVTYRSIESAVSRFSRDMEAKLDTCDLHGRCSTLLSDPRLTVKEVNETNLVWLKDGRLVFSRSELPPNENSSNLWSLQMDQNSGRAQGEPQRLTDWTGFDQIRLMASADGTRLLFQQMHLEWVVRIAEIEAGNGQLGKTRALNSETWSADVAGWTHDNKTVLFTATGYGKKGLFKQNISDPSPQVLASGSADYDAPVITPDGNWLLYTEQLQDGSARLMRMPRDGGPSAMVLPGGYRYRCATSPSILCLLSELKDKQMIFSVLDPFTGKGPELMRVDLQRVPRAFSWALSGDGRNVALVDFGDKVQILSTTGGLKRELHLANWSILQSVSWSADGAHLYVSGGYSSGMISSFGILQTDLTGNFKKLVEVPPDGGWVFQPIPSSDGRHLIYTQVTWPSSVMMLEKF